MPGRRWSLRRRLVVSIVAITSLVSFGIGTASVLGLGGYLEQRLDQQLTESVSRTLTGRVPGGGFSPTTTPADVLVSAPGLPLGTVAAVAALDGTTTTAVLLRGGQQSLPDSEAAALLAVKADGAPISASLGSSLGDYRVLAYQIPDGARVSLGLPLGEVKDTVAQFRGVVILISSLGLMIVAIASTLLVTLALRPLRRVAATASQVASLPLDRGEVSLAVRVPEADTDPHTEVGRVGAAFNSMLGHVDSALRARQSSENKVRQFVADASHELRTPLASIRGYAELTRRAGHELPEDITHSMRRVESEAVRMTALVEDLLLLARLDEGRELEKKPVDLAALLVDCLSDAYAAGPDHEWALDAPEDGVVILGDRQRIHQVVANLLANARVHTPAGSAVTVTLAVTAESSAVITVRDNGPGIAKSVREELFERFVRGDSSRARESGSTGLGLAIVRAVVEAHGGVVSVESSEAGSAFRLEFPGVP